MPLGHYGVLAGRVVDSRRENDASSPHFQVRVKAADVDYRIAVNVKSQTSPSELLFLVAEDFRHVVTDRLITLPAGFALIAKQPGGLALDFIRGNLFDRLDMRPLPPDLPGPDNDLSDRLAHFIDRARNEPDARIFAFGERWDPEPGQADKIFGFKPGNGIHDIHMNQGNVGQFVQDDGVWQDGAIVLHFPSTNQWVGIFLAFQSQAWHTDDRTGHRLEEPGPGPGPTPSPTEPDFRVLIVGALVNPIGPAPERETVTLLNATPQAIDLAGWQIADQQKRKQTLAGAIAAGEARRIALDPSVQLGNKGGIITLLDGGGLKVHGVSYTQAGADREGWTVVF
jgi:uncharacterized protein YukJ